MLSRYFIARPIFASVLAAFIVIAGLMAMQNMARTQWPDIQPRDILLSTFYPGANAETLASTVAAPIEQQIASVLGLMYTQSTSSGNGQLFIRATFGLDADIDAALLEINSRVQRVLSRLPEEVRRQGVGVTKSTSASLMIVTLTSPDRRFDLQAMSNYARLNIDDELSRLPGVAGVSMNTMRYFSMRIWLQPDKLARLGLSPLDVLDAVREQNSEYTAGRIGEPPLNEPVDFTFTVNVPGRLSTPKEFEDIVLHTSTSGAMVRLKDVARVELGGNRYDTTATLNGEVALPLNIAVENDANSTETARLVRARLAELSKSFPEGLAYVINYDSSVHVRNAINEVTQTLFEALTLVFLVVFFFMGSWRATLIPMLAVPVSIIGAFAIMYAMHFTINIVTLFGMVFAIGIVVDDAIVVMENVQRIMQTQGLDARAATEQTMREVTRPVVAIVLVLIAVFMPIAFLGGLTGTIYRQFAVTIAGSVAISGIVALTLTPALCATLLRKGDVNQQGFASRFQLGFMRATNGYMKVAEFLSRQRLLSAAIFVAMLGGIAYFAYRTPTSLVPQEDRGILYASPILPDAASISRSQAVLDALSADLKKQPAVQDVIAFAGLDGITGSNIPGGGSMWIMLKPWSDRRSSGMSPSDVVEHIEAFGKKNLRDAQVIAYEPSPIASGSANAGVDGFIQARGNSDPHALATAVQAFVSAAKERLQLTGVGTSYRANVPQIRIDVDRDKAKSMGVSMGDLFTTLHSNFGAYYINDFMYAGRSWEVQMQADAPFRARIDDLRNVFVRSANGALVPLTALIRVEETTGPEVVERFNAFPAARIFGRVAKGYSSGDAHAALEEIARNVLPPGYVLSWSGTSYQQRVIGKSANSAFLISVLMVFLILAAQYERWSLPLVVILAVPFAVFGAFVAIALRGLSNDIFFQIGLVTLVGLSAKNGVLMVEYAVHLHQQGKSARDAALEAARLRFRPIVMTSAAFIFGVLPLLFATGAGANARLSIGTGVIGGMLAATFIATLFVPLFYMWIAGFGKSGGGRPGSPD